MVERRFARTLTSLEAIYAFVREFLATHGIGQESAFDLDLIAEELFTNMVKYGRGAPEITIGLGWEAPTMTLRIVDVGAERFDPTERPPVDVDRPIGERHAGGLGLHLVKRIADRLDYTHDGESSTITVTKRLDP